MWDKKREHEALFFYHLSSISTISRRNHYRKLRSSTRREGISLIEQRKSAQLNNTLASYIFEKVLR